MFSLTYKRRQADETGDEPDPDYHLGHTPDSVLHGGHFFSISSQFGRQSSARDDTFLRKKNQQMQP